MKILKFIFSVITLFWVLVPVFYYITEHKNGVVSVDVLKSCNLTPEFELICYGVEDEIQIAITNFSKKASQFSALFPVLGSSLRYDLYLTNNLTSNLRVQVNNPEQFDIMSPPISCKYATTYEVKLSPKEKKELFPGFDPAKDIFQGLKCGTQGLFLGTKKLLVPQSEAVSTVIFDKNKSGNDEPEIRGTISVSYYLRKSSIVIISIGVEIVWLGFLVLLGNAVSMLLKFLNYFCSRKILKIDRARDKHRKNLRHSLAKVKLGIRSKNPRGLGGVGKRD